jgi:ATP-binding cassette subfamily B protein
MKKKLSLRARIKITKRGYHILKHYCPGLVQSKAMSAFLSALQPLVSVWFSAKIINELSDEHRISFIITYVAAVVIVNFSATLLRSVFDKAAREKEALMWSFFGKIFADKSMSMDYTDLEDARIQQQKKEATENLFMFGNGLGQLVWGTTTLVNAAVNIVVSATMTLTLFTSGAGNRMLDTPLWILVIAACIGLGGFSNSWATRKENNVFKAWSKDTVWFNRAFTFYGRELSMSPERAKDVRFYEQNFAAKHAFHNLQSKDKTDSNYIYHMSIYSALAHLVIGVSNVFCWVYVVAKAYMGAFGVGNIVQYIGALSKLGSGIQDMMFILADNEVYCTHLQSLFDYLDIPNRKYNGSLPVEKRAFCEQADLDYEIEFRNVSFRYPGTKHYALRNVSTKFKVGQKLAIVGRNGSGKSTFIKLLCRLYDPTEGEIRLNGIDIRNYNYDEYLSVFSVVFQDFKLFSFSLGQNVAAAVSYDREKAERSLLEAGFGERLAKMPKGLDTCLYKDFDTNGIEISGGEAQKIALARALYKASPFIILDEPTAALDPIAEAEIYTKFNDIIGDKTAIYISHRLSSCKFCDEIAVFQEGTIIQQGTHEELLADEAGKYFELWNAQAQYYTIKGA